MKFERFNDQEQLKISDEVKTQLENLGLTIDDIKGVILDVGSGEAEFAREIKKFTDADIISIDDTKSDNTSYDVIVADARNLPFEDEKFDKVISHASIPNVFIGMYSEEFSELSTAEIKKSIHKSFREMLRVLKPGSNAVMAPVRIADNYHSEKALAGSLEEIVDEIKDVADVSFELIREVENPQNHEKHKEYRLTLVKR
jgi:ubiquinone/menaquinone biosynthesis C-methylase UbiE